MSHLGVALASTLLAGGCAELSYLGKAEDAYDDGRYFEVAEDLADREDAMRDSPASKRARYGLYRGLSLLELGDDEGAEQWLAYARDVEAAHHTLSKRQRERLDAGLAELARRRDGGARATKAR